MKYFIYVFFICIFSTTLVAQQQFVRIIDFNGIPQSARQIVTFDNELFISYTQVCVDNRGNLLEECAGLLKIDEGGRIIDSSEYRQFSCSFNSIAAESNENIIYYSGEPNVDNNYAQNFIIGNLTSENIKNPFFKSFNIPVERQINYFQTTSNLFNGNLFVGGTSQILNENKITTIGLTIQRDQKLDTFLILDLGIGTILRTSYVDRFNRLSLHVQSQEGIKRFSHIVKYDTAYQIKWQWTSPETNNRQLPYGCELNDGRTVIAMHTPGFSSMGSVWAINEDKSISWKFEFPNKNTGQRREIRRLKELRNGDILGVGIYGDLRNNDPVFLKIPFIFRLNNMGQLIWLKAFYRDVYLPDNNLLDGSFLDAVELENGDIIAVGHQGNYLNFDPIINGPRPDHDILIIRMDANGCIDPKCETITKIESTVSTTQHNETAGYTAFFFPNPSDGSMELMNHTVVTSVSVFDLNGSLVFIQADPGRSLDLTGLPPGLYIAHLTLKDSKVIKQKMVVR